ncbi:ABC transporter permease [Candidatus Woesearchaeota archaeon]|nr:ABC transporter permease [Candidatus Woesearchaeota archaeon]
MKSYKLITFSLFILTWITLVEAQLVKPIFLPSLIDVLLSLKSMLFSIEGLKDVLFTLKRTVIGFFIALVIAVPLGVSLGLFRRLYDSIEWFIDFFRSVPVTAMFPLFLVFFGFGDASKIAMSAWACGFILLVNTVHGVWSAKKNRRIMAQTKRATSFQILTKITLFETLPFIFAGMRIGISWNLIVVIVAEMFIGTSHGLGHRIYDASIVFDTPGVIAGIVIIGLIGFFINRIILKLERKLIHWEGHT